MQKVKFNFSNLFGLIKCSLLGVVFTLLGTVIFAIVLKWVDLSAVTIDYINNAIIGISILLMIMCVNKMSQSKLLTRSILAGVIYALVSFLIFSILRGGIMWDMTIIFDLFYAVIVALISAMIVKLVRKKAL
ncbi:MAG: hypothetical protein ACLRFL_00400 [Clostridia bacterium]